jgi:hypothetical protein
MRIYQRLIAGDDENATEIGLEYLQEMPLERVYDEVLLPALATAQRDWHHGRLNDQQYHFNVEAMREIVDAVADKALEIMPPQAQKQENPPSCVLTAAEDGSQPAGDLPRGASLRVLCLPARDEADEVVGCMLKHLLQRRGYNVKVLSAESLASEMMDLIAGHNTDAVVISALPPQAIAHARYLMKRLWSRHPELTIVLGLWMTYREDKVGQIGGGGSARPVARLWQALEQMEQKSHGILIKGSQEETREAESQGAPRLVQRPA